MRYYSHLDMIRMFERALRRAQIPLVYTEGFNPRPKIAYGPPLSTGFLSETEYIDVFTYCRSRTDFIQALSGHLPADIEILQAKKLYHKTESLSQIINRADYHIEFIYRPDAENLVRRIEHFLQQEKWMIERKTKNKIRSVDIRQYVMGIDFSDNEIQLSVQMINGATLRVRELLRALLPAKPELVETARITRKAFWVQHGTYRLSPIEL